MDEEFLLLAEDLLVLERFVTDLVASIGSVGNQFTKEDFLVCVESVDDKGHELVNFGLELKCFNFSRHLLKK